MLVDAAERKIRKQPEMESKFYYFICQLIECDLHDALWGVFTKAPSHGN